MLYSRHRYAAGRPVAQACPTLATPWAVARQAPLSMGSSRQEYWSGLLFPSPGHLPDPGIGISSALQANILLLNHLGSSFATCIKAIKVSKKTDYQ